MICCGQIRFKITFHVSRSHIGSADVFFSLSQKRVIERDNGNKEVEENSRCVAGPVPLRKSISKIKIFNNVERKKAPSLICAIHIVIKA